MSLLNITFGEFRSLLHFTHATAQNKALIEAIDGSESVDGALAQLSHEQDAYSLFEQFLACVEASTSSTTHLALQEYAGRIRRVYHKLHNDKVDLLCTLPKEILVAILDNLCIGDLVGLFATCTRAREVREYVLSRRPLMVERCLRYLLARDRDSALSAISSQSRLLLGQQIARQGENITFLDLAACAHVSNDTLAAAVRLFPRLKNINLCNCWHVTDEGVQHLQGLQQLEIVSLGNCTIGDEVVRSLRVLPKLHSLLLAGCAISDDSVQHLTVLPLRYLNLSYCRRITKRCVEHIAQMPHLQKLYLYGVELDIEPLKSLAPNLTVYK